MRAALLVGTACLVTEALTGCGGSSSADSASGGTGNGTATGGTQGDAGSSATGGTGAGTGGVAGAPVSTGQVATLGNPCSPRGSLACAGNWQKLTLVCGGDDTWQVNTTCGEGEYCDSTEGPDAGSCRTALPECATEAAGFSFCADSSRMLCGPDGVTASLAEECAYGCANGACVAGPAPCLSGDDVLNCSADCGEVSEACNSFGLLSFPASSGAFWVRVGVETPVPPGRACASGRYVIDLDYGEASLDQTAIRATIDPPWWVAGWVEDQCTATGDTCYAGNPGMLYVGTDQPDAPPRNLRLEIGDEALACP